MIAASRQDPMLERGRPELRRRAILAGVAGNVMEWYDFSVYGYFAAVIGRRFFPAEDPIASLLAAFGVFAAGLFMRPFGSLVFGHIGDKMGRKAALTASVALMADGRADVLDRAASHLRADRSNRFSAPRITAPRPGAVGGRRNRHIVYLSGRAFGTRASRVSRQLWAVRDLRRHPLGFGSRCRGEHNARSRRSGPRQLRRNESKAPRTRVHLSGHRSDT